MTVTLQDLRDFANDQKVTQAYLDEAEQYVTDFVGTATVPENTLDQCIKRVGYHLWQLDHNPQGTQRQQLMSPDGIGQTPVRFARDAMPPLVKRTLRRYVLPW